MLFQDRSDAGRQLARVLKRRSFDRPVVLALPRGGVPVAVPVADALHAPLDLVLVRKIGHPDQPEFALGAVVDGEAPEIVINDDVVASLPGAGCIVENVAKRELEEIHRRRALYLADRPRAPIADRTAIVVDDGVATGATMRAALKAVARQRPARLVVAVPVAPKDGLADAVRDADETICLVEADRFFGVGQFYRDFRQVTDDEVVALLRGRS